MLYNTQVLVRLVFQKLNLTSVLARSSGLQGRVNQKHICLQLKSSSFSVCTLCPDKRASNMVSFQDMSLRLNSTPRVQVASNFSTEVTSHISLYRGREGLVLKAPLTNLVTSGCYPGSTIIDDRALRAVFMQLYPTPVAKRSPRKFIPSCKVAWRGLMFRRQQNDSHFLW